MPAAAVTKTEDLGESRVRLDVQVESDALEKEVGAAAAAMGQEMKIPGFRKGKVPPQVVLQRFGRDTVLDEAIRRGLPAWYEEAVSSTGIATVGDPKVDLGDLPEKGNPLSFSIEIGVRPEAELGEYKGLEAGRRESQVPDSDVDNELDALRDSLASLENVDGAAAKGNFVVLDFTGKVDGEEFEGGEARGYLLELGSGRLIEGFEEQLEGAKAGEQREVKVTFPDEYGADHLQGKEAVFDVEVKEVKEKKLPELNDDFAADAGGFDSLDELREDLRGRLAEAAEAGIEAEYREGVLDAAVANAKVDVPHDLVHGKAHEMWHGMARNLQRRGIDPSAYLRMTGKDEEELVKEMEADAEKSLKREAVLAAVVKAEGIEVEDAELLDSLRAALTSQGTEPPSDGEIENALERAKEQGRDEALREDIAMRKALDVMVDAAKPIEAGIAQAREEIWTPEKEAEEKSSKLWTPGS